VEFSTLAETLRGICDNLAVVCQNPSVLELLRASPPPSQVDTKKSVGEQTENRLTENDESLAEESDQFHVSSNGQELKKTVSIHSKKNTRRSSFPLKNSKAPTVTLSPVLHPSFHPSLSSLDFDLDKEPTVPIPSTSTTSTRHVFLENNNKVRLNVGGQIFVTTYSTLTRTKSMLARMFSGLFPLEKESDGTYFIDRDPATFSHILNYLRDGSIFVKGMDNNLKQALLREAKYYQIYGLVSLLQSDAKKSSTIFTF
jgi:hypothetical protein